MYYETEWYLMSRVLMKKWKKKGGGDELTEAEKIQKRREYHKEWNRLHPEKCREYKRNTAIRKAIKAINAGEVVVVERTALAVKGEAE